MPKNLDDRYCRHSIIRCEKDYSHEKDDREATKFHGDARDDRVLFSLIF